MNHVPTRPPLFIAVFSVLLLTGCGALSSVTGPIKALFEDGRAKESELVPWGSLPLQTHPTVPSHLGNVLALRETSSADQQLLTVGADGQVIGWDLGSGRGHALKRLERRPDLAALGLTHELIAYSSGQEFKVTCLRSCTRTWTLSRLKIKPHALAFHDNDTALLIGGADGRVYRWRFIAEAKAGSSGELEKALERYVAHQTVISSIAAHPFGRAFFSGDWQGELYGWLPYTADDFEGEYNDNFFGARPFTAPQTYTRAQRGGDRGVVSLDISENGEHLALGTEVGFVELWDIKGFIMAARLEQHRGRVLSVAVNSDGSIMASAGRDGTVNVLVPEPDPSYRLKAESRRLKLTKIASYTLADVMSVHFVSDNRLIATTAEGKLAELDVPKDRPAAQATPVSTPEIDTPPVDTDY